MVIRIVLIYLYFGFFYWVLGKGNWLSWDTKTEVIKSFFKLFTWLPKLIYKLFMGIFYHIPKEIFKLWRDLPDK